MLTQSFDLVLCDVHLPDTDGFSLKARLNNDKVRVPLIFLSGFPIKDGVDKSRQLGAIRFLVKPIPISELLGAVSKGIEYSQVINQKPEFKEPKALLVIKQGASLQEIKISRAYTIGRNKSSDIRLLSPQASREHGVLVRIYDDPNNTSFYKIIDYSRNGIEVNRKRIPGYHDLKHGDVIFFPACEIRYYELENLSERSPFETSPVADG